MILKLLRKHLLNDYTIGTLSVGDEYFCDTLEDTVRSELSPKVAGATAIPYGTYRVILSRSPRLDYTTPELLNVPNFTGIRIHAGNTARDTEGCILLGKNNVKGMVTDSKETFQKLVDLLFAHAGENIIITIS